MNKKILSIFLALALTITNGGVLYAAPGAPSAPSAPTAPSSPSTSEAPSAPDSPEAPAAPNPPGSEEENKNEDSQVSDTNLEESQTEENGSVTQPIDSESNGQMTDNDSGDGSSTEGKADPHKSNTDDKQVVADKTGAKDKSEQLDGADIKTGNANSSAVIENDANENISTGILGDQSGVSVVNDGNASGSSNSGSATIVDDSLTIQENSAVVVNDLSSVADSGHNEASKNLGDSIIQTGDANASGTIVNTVNTNVDGIMVSEFNIVDDHVGDYILDFEENCISGCGGVGIGASNNDNGSDSENIANVDYLASDASFQKNDADVENNMMVFANSGKNEASKNNQGDSVIATGNANAQASVLNFVNNNIAGDVIYGVVNIFGDLIGDIIVPESECCGKNDLLAKNSNNASESVNNTNLDYMTSDELYQFNNANIENNLVFEAETGGNEASKNNQGISYIETGDSSVDARVLNVANTNTSGEDMFLVLVNEAGKWFGKILGSDGNFGGSEGWEFETNEYGEILAQNSGNADGSTNTSDITYTENDLIVQENNANIVNNIKVAAVTGENDASKNNGGHSVISTGDANVVANIVNFVNNNIAGSGKLYVTTVNVFGNWFGNFITPDHAGDSDSLAKSSDSTGVGGIGYSQESVSMDVSESDSGSGAAQEKEVAAASITIENNAKESGYSEAGYVASAEIGLEAEIVPEVNAAETESFNREVSINLAWALYLVPLYFSVVLTRRKILPALRKTQS